MLVIRQKNPPLPPPKKQTKNPQENKHKSTPKK